MVIFSHMSQESAKLAPAVVHSKRADLVALLREGLKALGSPDPVQAKNADDCIERLIKDPGAILCIDWQLGSEEVNQVLGAIRGHFKIETRPVLMVIDEIEANVISTAAEYGVSQMHAGTPAPDTIRECLQALITEDEQTKSLKDVLVQVAVARGKGDWAIATPMLMELYDKHPGNERIALELAENLIAEGHWDQAEQVIQPYMASEPPNIRALHLMGRCFMSKGKFEEAIKLLEKAKIVNPHNVDRLIDLGDAFLNNNQIDEAMANFKEATALDEENKEAKFGQGKCLLMNGEVNEALALLKSMSGPREMASIFNTAAVLSMHHGAFEKGMQLYRSAFAALGRNDKIGSRLMFNMGLGFRRWKKEDKALACFARSLELDPTYLKAAKHKELAEKALAHTAPTAAPAAAPAKAKDKDHFAEDEFTNPAGVTRPKPVLNPNQPVADDPSPDEFDVGE